MEDHKGTPIEVGSKVGIPGVVTAIHVFNPLGGPREELIYIDIDTTVLGGGDPQRIVVKSHHVEVMFKPEPTAVATPLIPESDLEKSAKEGDI